MKGTGIDGYGKWEVWSPEVFHGHIIHAFGFLICFMIRRFLKKHKEKLKLKLNEFLKLFFFFTV